MTDEPKTDTKADEPLLDANGMPTRRGWRVIGAALRREMPSKKRPGRGGTFDYITARQVAERLDSVVGPGNWSTAFRVLNTDEHVVECTLTVFGVQRADVGYSNNPDSDNEPEPFKAAYSDAFKRAAVQFGVGRWLYKDT